MLRPMGKAKRSAKKERKKNKQLQAELEEERRRIRRNRRLVMFAVPVITLALAAGANWGLENGTLAGAVLGMGVLAWLMVGLFYLGANVQPRDRTRAGSIDFGGKR